MMLEDRATHLQDAKGKSLSHMGHVSNLKRRDNFIHKQPSYSDYLDDNLNAEAILRKRKIIFFLLFLGYLRNAS